MAPPTTLNYHHISQAECLGYWRLDEEAGSDRVATLGNTVITTSDGSTAPDLVENGTVPQGTRALGHGADFDDDDNNFLECTLPIDTATKGVWCWAIVRPDGTAQQCIMSMHDGVTNSKFILELRDDNRVRFLVSNSAGTLVGHSHTQVLVNGTEYVVQAFLEEDATVAGRWYVKVKVDFAAEEIGSYVDQPWGIGTVDFRVGSRHTSGSEQGFNGLIAEVGVFNRTPSVAERTLLPWILKRREHVFAAIPEGYSNPREVFSPGDGNGSIFWGMCLSSEGSLINRNRLDYEVYESSEPYGDYPNGIQIYYKFPKPNTLELNPFVARFDPETLDAIEEIGAIPVYTLEPMYFNSQGQEKGATMEQILEGAFDEYFLYLCENFRKYKRVVVRFMHEFNLNTYHWTEDEAADYNADTPPRYIAVWRYVIRFFREEGLDNLLWAWCANESGVPNEAWNVISNYWPGAGWVDVVGTDGYDWQNTETWSDPKTFEEAMGTSVEDVRAVAGYDLPFIVFETGTRLPEGASWDAWWTAAVEVCKRKNIVGVLPFDVSGKDWFVYGGFLQRDDLLFVPNHKRKKLG